MKKNTLYNFDFNEIINMIETRRNNVYKKVNEELISLYWDFGKYPTMKRFNKCGIYRNETIL